jgi:hypothetical protein
MLAAVALAACGDDGDEGEAVDRPGLGRSTAAPTGRPVTLPAGVSVASPFAGSEGALCDTEDGTVYGAGWEVSVCLPVTNEAEETQELVLPCGTVLVSQTPGTQNGLLLQRAVLPLLPGAERTFPLFAFCANEHRTPSTAAARYVLGPVTDDEDVLELCRLLEDKDLRDGNADAQDLLWHITEGSGLTREDRELIDGMMAL